MFELDSRGLLQCTAWREWEWLDHGFSTRHSANWLEKANLASLKQVHGDVVIAANHRGLQGEADALITREPGLYVAVRTADCFPILLVDPKRRAIAAVHCGWRGTLAGLARKTVPSLADQFGSRPEHLHAALGPGIGACCFEVGPEVAQQFGRMGRAKIDLAGELAEQLASAGLPQAQISVSTDCTLCRPDLYWSYRREGQSAGRMWSGIAVRAGREER